MMTLLVMVALMLASLMVGLYAGVYFHRLHVEAERHAEAQRLLDVERDSVDVQRLLIGVASDALAVIHEPRPLPDVAPPREPEPEPVTVAAPAPHQDVWLLPSVPTSEPEVVAPVPELPELNAFERAVFRALLPAARVVIPAWRRRQMRRAS